MKGSAKRSNRWVILFSITGVLLIIGVYQLFFAARTAPSYTGKIERRDYELLVMPLEGPSFDARVARIKHKINKPGQAKLFDLFTSGTPPNSFQAAFEKFGYRFPPGTEAVSIHSTTTSIFYIQHYPDVLDRLEAEFQLEQR